MSTPPVFPPGSAPEPPDPARLVQADGHAPRPAGESLSAPGLAPWGQAGAAWEEGFQLLAPAPPEVFPLIRSEDGRLALTNEALEINGQGLGWRELEAVDVQPVRWLLWLLLGGFTLAGFTLGFLQNWLRTIPAAAGMAAGALLLAFGTRGSNRWRLHRPGQEAAYFALSGSARGWQQLATEANRRIRVRHDEAAAAAAYWLQQSRSSSVSAAAAPNSPTEMC